jgi:hypothetical protein
MGKPNKASKLPSEPVILVRRAEYLRALTVLSEIIQLMGMEFEEIKASKEMDPDVRRTLLTLTSTHLQNVTQVSNLIGACNLEPRNKSNKTH